MSEGQNNKPSTEVLTGVPFPVGICGKIMQLEPGQALKVVGRDVRNVSANAHHATVKTRHRYAVRSCVDPDGTKWVGVWRLE